MRRKDKHFDWLTLTGEPQSWLALEEKWRLRHQKLLCNSTSEMIQVVFSQLFNNDLTVLDGNLWPVSTAERVLDDRIVKVP